MPIIKDCQSVLDKWNSQARPKSGWKTHRELKYDLIVAITGHLKYWDVEDMCDAIDNYAMVFHGKEYTWSYKKCKFSF